MEGRADGAGSDLQSGTCRQDTWSDLQLFGIVNLAVIFLFSWLKAHLVDVADSGTSAEEMNKPFWTSLYEVPAQRHCTPSISASSRPLKGAVMGCIPT